MWEQALDAMQAALERARTAISLELAEIPPPAPACDVNFNRLLEERARIADALQVLGRLRAAEPDRAAVLAFCRTADGLDAACRCAMEAMLDADRRPGPNVRSEPRPEGQHSGTR